MQSESLCALRAAIQRALDGQQQQHHGGGKAKTEKRVPSDVQAAVHDPHQKEITMIAVFGEVRRLACLPARLPGAITDAWFRHGAFTGSPG
jgi:hypothetical protein